MPVLKANETRSEVSLAEGSVTSEIIDDIRNMGIVFHDIPYSCIFQIIFQIFAIFLHIP